MRNQRGFTLIELLVAMAIIGILTSIVLMYLGDSRDKGADASVKSNLVSARSSAEVFYTNHNRSYEGVCLQASSDGVWTNLQAAVKATSRIPKATAYDDATPSTGASEECHDSVGDYVVWVPLKKSTAASPQGWCIDSRNASRRVTQNITDGAGSYQYRCPP